MTKESLNRTFTFAALVFASTVVLHCSDVFGLNDHTIKNWIEARVAASTELNGAQVRVDVNEGVVAFSGKVRFMTQKLLCEKIGRQAYGGVKVENEIRVTPVIPLDDEAIELRIREIVETHRRFREAELDFTIENGAVEIQGTFEYPHDVSFLERRIAELEGVISIVILARFNI